MERIWLKNYSPAVHPDINFSDLKSVSQLIDRAFTKYSRLPAASCMDTTMTYGELAVTVSRFASFLQNGLGIKKGDRIAIMLPNTLQFLIAELAALKLGAICVNTNPLYTPREMKHQFVDSGARAIVILDLFTDKLEEILKETQLEHVIVTAIGDQLPIWKGFAVSTFMRLKGVIPQPKMSMIRFKDALSKGDPKQLVLPDLSLDDLAILQYTGGTTGISKGAMLTQRNVLANMLQIQEVTKDVLEPGTETVLTALPLYHIFALTVNFLAFFANGQHMILVPKPIPIENTVSLFKKYRITVMTGVNTLFNSLNNNKTFQTIAPRTLKVVVAGGMALQESVSRSFQAITGTRITEGFGLTEASPVTHVNPLSPSNPVGSIGIPLPSTFAKVVGDDGRDLLPGETGELVVRGPQVMKGYWKRDDETAKTLRDGWLLTGDMARMNEDGFFFIVDRKKDMVLVSGFNVYPNEVEDVLASHPKVLEAAVVGVPDKTSGEAVKAFIVVKDKSLTVEELKAYCKENLTGYKIPRHFEFRDQLPKSNIGKILRRELRDGR
jgi:long-chain acyl-CoA synthetase